MTGHRFLSGTLQDFLILTKLFLVLTSLLPEDGHLYFVNAAQTVQPCRRIQEPDDCLHSRNVAMVTDSTDMGGVTNCFVPDKNKSDLNKE